MGYLSYMLRMWLRRDSNGEPVWSASLQEPGSHRTLYKGTGKIDVAVLDTTRPYEGPVLKKSITVEYPKSRGPIPVADDNNTDKFRDMLVNRMATEICWLFTTHPFSEECQCD